MKMIGIRTWFKLIKNINDEIVIFLAQLVM